MFLANSCRVSEELDSQDPASSGEDEKGAHDDENVVNVVNREWFGDVREGQGH